MPKEKTPKRQPPRRYVPYSDPAERYSAEPAPLSAEKYSTTANSTESSSFSAVVTASNAFAFAMYKELMKTEGDENFFFSPMSITAALAMTHLGAAGDTAEEIKSALNAKDIKDKDFHSAFSTLNAKLNTAEGSACTLRMANRIFPAKNFAVKETFNTATKTLYTAEAHSLDFATDTENSRRTINSWVESQTNDKIQDLLPKGIIDEDTVMVLVNAIYFKGTWLDKFDTWNTTKQDWTLPSKKTTKADVMLQITKKFKLSILPSVLYAELPYKGEGLSLGIMLPKKIEDLRTLQNDIDIGTYEKMIGEAKITDMDMYLPKFKIVTSAGLKGILKSLGISSAFDEFRANFTNIADAKIFVSAVVHKAFVEVNEHGTEAAAATAVIATCTSSSTLLPFQFKATHPFVFFIKDNTTGAILFMGRLMNPNK